MSLQETYFEWMTPRMVHIPYEQGGKEYLIPSMYQFHLIPDLGNNRLTAAFVIVMDYHFQDVWYFPQNWSFL